MQNSRTPWHTKVLISHDDKESEIHILKIGEDNRAACGEKIHSANSTYISNTRIPVTCPTCLLLHGTYYQKVRELESMELHDIKENAGIKIVRVPNGLLYITYSHSGGISTQFVPL